MTSVFSSLLNSLTLGISNVTRRKGRAAFALIAIASGVVAILLSGGFLNWIFEAIRESTIHSQLGHIRIALPGYAGQGSSDPFRYVIGGTPPELASIEHLPGVKIIAPRLSLAGLALRATCQYSSGDRPRVSSETKPSSTGWSRS